jgi:hypothetical protein
VRGNSARAAKHAFLYIFTFQRTQCGPRRRPAGRDWCGRGACLYSNVYHTIFLRPGEVVY